jgi:hypothetical protein
VSYDVEINKRRANGNLDIRNLLGCLGNIIGQLDRTGAIHVHLPITGDKWLTHDLKSLKPNRIFLQKRVASERG